MLCYHIGLKYFRNHNIFGYLPVCLSVCLSHRQLTWDCWFQLIRYLTWSAHHSPTPSLLPWVYMCFRLFCKASEKTWAILKTVTQPVEHLPCIQEVVDLNPAGIYHDYLFILLCASFFNQTLSSWYLGIQSRYWCRILAKLHAT